MNRRSFLKAFAAVAGAALATPVLPMARDAELVRALLPLDSRGARIELMGYPVGKPSDPQVIADWPLVGRASKGVFTLDEELSFTATRATFITGIRVRCDERVLCEFNQPHKLACDGDRFVATEITISCG